MKFKVGDIVKCHEGIVISQKLRILEIVDIIFDESKNSSYEIRCVYAEHDQDYRVWSHPSSALDSIFDKCIEENNRFKMKRALGL